MPLEPNAASQVNAISMPRTQHTMPWRGVRIPCHVRYYGYLQVPWHVMSSGTCQQEHTGSTGTHTHSLNRFPSNGRSASAGAARICCCTLSICTEQQLITSLTLITTVCARTECNALNMRPCHRRTASRDRDRHAYIANMAYIMPSMKSHAHNMIVRCHQSRAQVQTPFRRPQSRRLQPLEGQQPQSPYPHSHPLV